MWYPVSGVVLDCIVPRSKPPFLLSNADLLTHTLLFWHFLENLNFELKSTSEYIRTMFFGNACLFAETTDSEHLRY